ncbi:hypothetical protein [Pedobacter mucosus]|uniref:hypothetical protein n=1 Tax=Pedobacter mucosus TaxID=2895286 RepID=UPI001EE3B410|nr:hypothetical protein [Pedobacter mucosus]UKT65581.1 hypothetical protein LOK61_07265 [Pedobacter mucosus]
MKRIFIVIAIACSTLMMLQSCNTAKRVTAGVTGSRGTVVREWVVSNVSLDGLPDGAVQGLFGEKSYKCFEGSAWNLTNSGNGSYTLPSTSACGAVMQTIFWSASPKEETFQFKKIFEGDKAKNVTEGYRLILTELSSTQMVMKSPIEFGGKTANIILTFVPAAK